MTVFTVIIKSRSCLHFDVGNGSLYDWFHTSSPFKRTERDNTSYFTDVERLFHLTGGRRSSSTLGSSCSPRRCYLCGGDKPLSSGLRDSAREREGPRGGKSGEGGGGKVGERSTYLSITLIEGRLTFWRCQKRMKRTEHQNEEMSSKCTDCLGQNLGHYLHISRKVTVTPSL